MKQRILVLGASGFIGKRLVKSLADSDWATPIAASRRASTSINIPSVEKIDIDSTSESLLTSAVANVTAIVNCVAGDSTSIRKGGEVLFKVASQQPTPPRIVHLSSMAAYGSITGSVDESTPLKGDLDDYSAAKSAVEEIARSYANRVVLRPGIVYGPNSPWWSDRIARLLLAKRLGNLGQRGQGRCNLVHVDDVVSAIIASLRKMETAGQAFNLSCPNPPTWNDYFALYGRALGMNSVVNLSALRIAYELNVHALPLKIAEIIASKLGKPNLVTAPPLRPWLIKLCQHDITLQVNKAESLLGMNWIPLAQGLKQSADWFLAGHRT